MIRSTVQWGMFIIVIYIALTISYKYERYKEERLVNKIVRSTPCVH